MADVTLGAKRTLTVTAATVTNVTLPFNVRRLEIEKQNEPLFYVNIGSAIDTGSLDEAKVIKADILSFSLYNEPTDTGGSPPIDLPFNLVSFYGTAEFTINFITLSASASS